MPLLRNLTRPRNRSPRCLLAEFHETTAAGQPGSSAPLLEEISAAFPDLEIIELIGKGGMGTVYKARPPSNAGNPPPPSTPNSKPSSPRTLPNRLSKK